MTDLDISFLEAREGIDRWYQAWIEWFRSEWVAGRDAFRGTSWNSGPLIPWETRSMNTEDYIVSKWISHRLYRIDREWQTTQLGEMLRFVWKARRPKLAWAEFLIQELCQEP